MLYLNSAPFVNLKTVPDLTLTSVVFELVKTSLINLLLLYHLTLTSVVLLMITNNKNNRKIFLKLVKCKNKLLNLN